MPVAVAVAVVAFLADAMKGLVGRVLVALGIGAITATGFNAVIGAALTQAQNAFSAVGTFGPALQAVGVLWFISTLLSAVSTRLALRGLTSDSVSFWVLRRGLPTS